MEARPEPVASPLPSGTRLVHIGPSKTGTTSVQAAMWAGRSALRAQGVLYAGRARHNELAARAVAGLRSVVADDGAPPPMRYWTEVVKEVRAAREPRVVFSSEFLAHAEPTAIRRVVADLDPGRVRVVVTLRPLAKLLASQWQQNIQAGRVIAYDRWLDHLFNRPESEEWRLWYRHRHDQLIERWGAVVGLDRVTAVVVDDRDHEHVLRQFEALLGVRPGTLRLQRDLANRSLTLAEIDALRAFNEAFKAQRLGKALHTQVMRIGVAAYMKSRVPGADERRIETPAWALERADEAEREIVGAIDASGVRVVGDLGRLLDPPAVVPSDGAPEPDGIPAEIAASLAMGVLVASGQARRPRPAPAAVDAPDQVVVPVDPPEIARVPTRRVAGIALRRVRTAGFDWWAVTRRRIGSVLGTR